MTRAGTRRGFTLAEVLVASTISGFVAVVAVSALNALAGNAQTVNRTTETTSVIRFAARSDGPVQASIHDLAGRRVRGLSRGVLGAGDHDLFWDGRDDGGRAVAAGSYLVRITSSDGSTAARFVVIR